MPASACKVGGEPTHMVSCSTIVIYTISSDPAYLTRRNRCAGGAIVTYEVYAEPQTLYYALVRLTIPMGRFQAIWSMRVSR